MTSSPLGDSALVLSLGEPLGDDVLQRVAAITARLTQARLRGVTDVVPAYDTVTVFYDIAGIVSFSALEKRVLEYASEAVLQPPSSTVNRTIEIPVCYGGEHGPDLPDVAVRSGLDQATVIRLHSSAEYRVDALGFVPGFAYLTGLPDRLHTPRRATPRLAVEPGSVSIGGDQTGIYPGRTPGGWNVIGRTPLVLFELARTPPALLRVGDHVRFRPISPEDFAAWP